MKLSRRQLLAALGATAALGGVRARAAVSASERRFVFVLANGGWDTTRVFTPSFDLPQVDMEEQAAAATAGDLRFVDHPDRPSVRAFFEAYHSRLALLNGMLVPSVAHEACRGLLLTGGSAGTSPDWPTTLAAARRDAFPLPHLVLGNVSFPGDLTEVTCRVGGDGQLDGLLDGSLIADADVPVEPPEADAEALLDAFTADAVARRLAQQPDPAWQAQLQDYDFALARAGDLKTQAGALSFVAGGTMSAQATLAADVLARGVSRCVSIEHPVIRGNHAWDSHSQNDTMQQNLFEDLFAGLVTLMEALDTTAGPSGATLAEETVVVVLSEMGRTPWLTPSGGKDHWPYTSALVLGSGIAGGRTLGGMDESFYGWKLDPTTGERRDDGVRLSFAELGATLMALGDVDPGERLPEAGLLEAILS
ncbi:MAG: DUF1501 domain-containing protein [Alphaproteobacteria bacterium]|nr:DUF1501 domain-containing protein [Alphaproteobacteria bacterium]